MLFLSRLLSFFSPSLDFCLRLCIYIILCLPVYLYAYPSISSPQPLYLVLTYSYIYQFARLPNISESSLFFFIFFRSIIMFSSLSSFLCLRFHYLFLSVLFQTFSLRMNKTEPFYNQCFIARIILRLIIDNRNQILI